MRRFFFIAFALLLAAPPTWASEYAINCYVPAGTSKAWELPAGNDFKDLAVMTLPNNTGGDMILTGDMVFPTNNTADARISYQFLIDGIKYGPSFVGRFPDDFASGQFIRAAAPNIATGNHTVKLQARNLSGTALYFYYAGVSALVVDSSENTASTITSTDISVGSSWTTLGSTTVQIGTDKMIQLGGSVRIYSGTTGDELQYRFVDAGSQLVLFEDAVPDAANESATVGAYVANPTSGSRTISLQARRVTGLGTITVRSSYLFAQTMPRYHMFEAESTSISPVARDGQFHTLISSAPDFISPVGNSNMAFVSSFSTVTLSDQTVTPLRFRQQLLKETASGSGVYADTNFDNGISTLSPSASQILLGGGGQGNGCSSCGWNQSRRYKAELRVKTICSSSGSIYVDRAKLQFVFVPNYGYSSTGYTCSRGSQLNGPASGHPLCP